MAGELASYDLAGYLCPPSGAPYILIGMGYEVCYSKKEPSGYTYQVKNSAAETRWYDENFIYLGLDTSSKDANPPTVYAQYTDGRYGAAWAKRYMAVGERFLRNPDLRVFTRQGAPAAGSGDNVQSYMVLAKHWDTYTFTLNGNPQGTVKDVLELHWVQPDGSVIEHYFYGKGIGLVAFHYLPANQQSVISVVTPAPGEVQAREVLAWFHEPTPPPVEAVTPPSYVLGAPMAARCITPNGLILRATPNGVKVDTVAKGEAVVVRLPAPPQNVGGFGWGNVAKSNGNVGWCALAGDWGNSFEPITAPPTAFRLKAPFKRYTITDRFNAPRNYSTIAPTKKQLHEGIDLIDANAQQFGTDPIIHVGAPGKVLEVGYQATGYGNFVLVDFGGGWRAYYGHMAEVYVKAGQVLKDWQILGLMGATGFADGAHAHLTVQNIPGGLDGYVVADVVDPEPLLVAV